MPAKDNRPHAAPPELEVEIRAVKRPPLPLGDQEIAFPGANFRHQFGPVGRQARADLNGGIRVGVERVLTIRGEGDAD